MTVIEGEDRLLPREDLDASQVIGAVFDRDGIGARTGARVAAVPAHDGQIRLTLADASVVSAEKLLVAVAAARSPTASTWSTSGYASTTAATSSPMSTWPLRQPACTPAGDVTGRLPFTHAAFHMGRVAAGNALARRPWQRRRYRPTATPWVTFTDPEVAQVGVTEHESARRGGRVADPPLAETDRALAADATNGFIKLVAGPRRILGDLGGGRILGATIVAERAGEMIHEPALAMATVMFTGRLAAATHAYPTWSYAVQLAAAQFFMTIGGRIARPARPAPKGH